MAFKTEHSVFQCGLSADVDEITETEVSKKKAKPEPSKKGKKTKAKPILWRSVFLLLSFIHLTPLTFFTQ